MASQNLNVGTAANANDGDTLRAAFIKVKQMFAEIYGQTYSEQGDLSGVTFEIKEDKLKATNSAIDGYVLTYDSASGGFTWEQKFDGDITGIVAGNGLTGDATTGDATLAVGEGNGISVSANEISVADNLQVGGTESIGVPSGTTTQRNAITTPTAGMFRFNTTDSQFEGYDGSAWGEIGGSSGSTLYVDTFNGDGSDTTFDLSQSISSENDTQVYIDGVYQSKNTYSVSGTTITFSEAPATGTDNIEVIHIKAIANTTVADDSITYAKLSDEFTTRDSNVTLASGSATKDIDFDSKAVYEVTLPTGNVPVTLNFDGAEIGMTKVIIIKTQSSAYTGTITFSQTTGTGTFVRLSSDDIVKDLDTTNYLQATCIDKSGDNCTFIYTVGTSQS